MKVTTIGISIHSDRENPIFGETCTHLILEDEAAGPFFIIRQYHDNIKPGEVRLELEELELLLKEAKKVYNNYPDKS